MARPPSSRVARCAEMKTPAPGSLSTVTASPLTLLALGLLLALGGCVIAPASPHVHPWPPVAGGPPGPVIEVPPPPRLQEPMPVAPGPAHVWIGGYWAWHLGRHVWVAGRWALPPPGQYWVPGYWGRHGPGWRWHGGYWRRR